MAQKGEQLGFGMTSAVFTSNHFLFLLPFSFQRRSVQASEDGQQNMLVVVQSMLQVYASVILEINEESSSKEENLLNTVITSRSDQWDGVLRSGLIGDSRVCSLEEFLTALQVILDCHVSKVHLYCKISLLWSLFFFAEKDRKSICLDDKRLIHPTAATRIPQRN